MVKTKKGKKEIVSTEDVETNEQVNTNADVDLEDEPVIEKPNKKKGNKNKKNAKKIDDSGSEDDNASEKPKIKTTAKHPGFDLLMANDESDDDDETNSKRQSDDDEKEESTKKNQKKGGENENSKQGKKSKKAKKKKDDDDEDLDRLLAELQMEYDGEKVESKPEVEQATTNEDKKKIKGIKNQKSEEKNEDEASKADDAEIENDCSTVKTAAQKKKEKKERQKRDAALGKQKAANQKNENINAEKEDIQAEMQTEPQETTNEKIDSDQPMKEVMMEDSKTDDKKNKKKKDKSKKDKEEEKKDEKKKGVSKAMVAAMQERLKKIKEEEERLEQEEQEKIRQEEEREEQRLAAIRLEQEKKEKKKQREIERKARLKAEGKLLTKKQKDDRARAQAMLDALKAQGVDIPDPADRRPRPGTRIRQNKKKDKTEDDKTETNECNEEKTDVDTATMENKKEIVKEAWDASSSEDEDENKSSETQLSKAGEFDQKSLSDDESDGSSDESISDDSNEEEDNKGDESEMKRKKIEDRMEKRKIEAKKKLVADNLRAAIVCVLGHVDTGKTKILDKLRRTNVQDSEAGGITQQIGATNVPIDAIKEQARIVKNSAEFTHKMPGLLIIDTPGHESFSNLRSRGSSLCDIAILVVDIMHGLEPQTIESINLLKSKKTPFIVALNKIDRLYDWQIMQRKDIRDIMKNQQTNTQLEFTQRTKEVILQFAEHGLNAALFYENPDPRTYISLVPTSAITGEGMGNLLFLICEFCQSMLSKRLMYSEQLQATVLEVKAIPGLGTTIDAILINGKLREGETMIVAGTDGPIVTQIRSLLMPQPLKELRVKNAYQEHKEIRAAQGVKIAAKDLEKAIAGINLLIAHKPDEIEVCKEEVAKELKHALSHIKLKERGVYVQASTLGSLEALLEFLRTSKIPYSAIRIGPVVKRDVMKASTMLEHEPEFATILAFDVKIERDAQDLADSLDVKIFQADIIYHLFDKFMAYREELKQKKRNEFKSIAVFPCKLKILPQFVFNSRDPIVIGVMIEAGIVKEGTPICVPSKEFVDIGVVTSIESNHKQVESARKGMEVCIKIEPIPGESPKMFGRHFEADDMLMSKITRQSIDACKDYFRDDLLKTDWALMVELKKLFQIL